MTYLMGPARQTLSHQAEMDGFIGLTKKPAMGRFTMLQ